MNNSGVTPPPTPGPSSGTGATDTSGKNTPPIGKTSQQRTATPTQGQKNIPAADQNNSATQTGDPTQKQATGVTDPQASVNPAAQARQQKIKALERAQAALQNDMEEMFVRDQLELVQQLIQDPELAKQLGIKINVRAAAGLPMTQVVPPPETQTGPDILKRNTDFLQQMAPALLEQAQNKLSDADLRRSYVLNRSNFMDLAKQLAKESGTDFQWAPYYFQLMFGAIDRQVTIGGHTMHFTRPKIDMAEVQKNELLKQQQLQQQLQQQQLQQQQQQAQQKHKKGKNNAPVSVTFQGPANPSQTGQSRLQQAENGQNPQPTPDPAQPGAVPPPPPPPPPPPTN